MVEAIFRSRYVSIVAVVFGAVGAVTMFLIGAVTTIKAIGVYLGADEFKALSSDAALATTVDFISALDQFLLGLVLLVFAYGVYSLWIVADAEEWESERERVNAPDWLKVGSVTDLKVKLLEVIAVLLAVLFLKGAIQNQVFTWPDLVVPASVLAFGLTIWLIRKAH
ncbi:MAG: YqhA family protein [Acidimicrobiia bacterium]|nr:YqhA family protein [Acidimicrobiia bacterium]